MARQWHLHYSNFKTFYYVSKIAVRLAVDSGRMKIQSTAAGNLYVSYGTVMVYTRVVHILYKHTAVAKIT
jgi:hypothetical protein